MYRPRCDQYRLCHVVLETLLNECHCRLIIIYNKEIGTKHFKNKIENIYNFIYTAVNNILDKVCSKRVSLIVSPSCNLSFSFLSLTLSLTLN